jgi:SHAQKYF class myb-like DNA-binding protein
MISQEQGKRSIFTIDKGRLIEDPPQIKTEIQNKPVRKLEFITIRDQVDQNGKVKNKSSYIPKCREKYLWKKMKTKLNNSKMNFREGRWEQNEHRAFILSCLKYRNNWKRIQEDVRTRTAAQIRSHAQKFVIRLCRKYKIKRKNDIFEERSLFAPKISKKTKLNRIRYDRPVDETLCDELKILTIFNYNVDGLIYMKTDSEDNCYSQSDTEANGHKSSEKEDQIRIKKKKKIKKRKKVNTLSMSRFENTILKQINSSINEKDKQLEGILTNFQMELELLHEKNEKNFNLIFHPFSEQSYLFDESLFQKYFTHNNMEYNKYILEFFSQMHNNQNSIQKELESFNLLFQKEIEEDELMKCIIEENKRFDNILS